MKDTCGATSIRFGETVFGEAPHTSSSVFSSSNEQRQKILLKLSAKNPLSTLLQTVSCPEGGICLPTKSTFSHFLLQSGETAGPAKTGIQDFAFSFRNACICRVCVKSNVVSLLMNLLPSGIRYSVCSCNAGRAPESAQISSVHPYP